MIKPNFTKPKLCKGKKGWYVYFRYDGKLKRYKYGINRIKDLKEREKEGRSLARVLHKKLKSGWNPLVRECVELQKEMYFDQAIMFALSEKKKKIAPKTYLCYKSTITLMLSVIKSLGYGHLYITEVKRPHIRRIMERAKFRRKWSNVGYNKNLNYIKAVMSELLDWDIIESNPAHKIKNLPTGKSRANIPPTDEQKDKIVEHLKNHHYNFYVYVAMIYHTGVRCWEALQLKIGDIDLDRREIVLPANITKTNKERIVPINDYLFNDLISLGVDVSQDDYYVFGSFRKEGRGNNGPKNDFCPGPTKLIRDTATKRWFRIVKKGLGIDVNLYAMKHKGADDKILAGIELSALQELYGHESRLMTERYARKVKEVHRKQIMDKSPSF